MTAALSAAISNLSFYGSLTLSGTSTGFDSLITPSDFSVFSSARAGSRIYYLTVDSGAVRWGKAQTSYLNGLYLSGFTAGDLIILTNNGIIAGAGGNGSSTAGVNGSDAISLGLDAGVSLQVVNNGTIAGGGGGGGGGSSNNVSGGGGQGSGGSGAYNSVATWNTTGPDGSTPGVGGIGGGGGTIINGTGAASNVNVYTISQTNYGPGLGGGGGGAGTVYGSTNSSSSMTLTGGAGGGPGVAGSNGSASSIVGSPIWQVAGGGGGWGAAGGSGSNSSGGSYAGGSAGRAISTTSASLTVVNNGTIYGAY